MDHVFFNRPIDHQSTSNDRLKPVITTGLVNMHIDRSIANLAGESQTSDPPTSSLTLYHWANVLLSRKEITDL